MFYAECSESSKTKKNVSFMMTESDMLNHVFPRRLGGSTVCIRRFSMRGLDASYKPLCTLVSSQNAGGLVAE